MSGKSTRGARVRAVVGDPWIAAAERLFLAETGLSVAARLTLIYMLDLARRPEWTIYVAHIQRELGLSRDRWRRIRKELEAAGYYAIKRERDEAGRVSWVHTVFDRPQPDAQKGDDTPVPPSDPAPNNPIVDPTIVGKSNDGETADGETADGQAIGGESDGIRRSTSLTITKRRSSKYPRAAGQVNVATLAAGGAISAVGGADSKRRRTHASGIVYWESEELAEIDLLVAEFGEDAVREVVVGLADRGCVPYQSRVAVVLFERRERAHRAKQERRAQEAPESSVTLARKVAADMRAAGHEPSVDLLSSAGEQPHSRKG